MLLLGWTALFICMCQVLATETDHLSYYETLSHVHVSSHVKRSSQTQAELVKRVQFHAFQRDFHLTLKSGAAVLAKGFRARLVHKDGSSTILPLDPSKIFTGHNTYNAQTVVHAHLEESLWSIQIIEEDEIYAVEPAWRILKPSENPHNDTLVAYRLSDVKDFTDGHPFCSVSEQGSSEKQQDVYQNASQAKPLKYLPHASNREKRSFTNKVCLISIVGDTDFFKKRCKFNSYSCLSLMVQHIQFVDQILKSSAFEDRAGEKHYGIGVQVAELIILPEYTTPSTISPVRHFNEDYDNWDADNKLTSFAKYTAFGSKRFCLNHLFSEFPDQGGILGLAYVNQLCRHNFGAHHDPQTAECGPEDNVGGKFIMWKESVSGDLRNNKRFSICSLRQIGRNIPARCFIPRSQPHSVCGNGIVDAGEECDAGFFGSRGDNKCCTENCMLRPGALCSEINHECCFECGIASANTACHNTVRIYSCKNQSYCSGTSLECIEGGFMPDDTDCGEKHKCYGGICMNPCQLMSRQLRVVDLRPCLCKDNASEACNWCCFDATDPDNPGKCKPIMSDVRNDGTRCFKGICESGICVPDLRFQSRTILNAYIEFVKTSSF
ncbi:disintegrin and metalloproteinase domain-containing protein 17, partial [Elysia marginata]